MKKATMNLKFTRYFPDEISDDEATIVSYWIAAGKFEREIAEGMIIMELDTIVVESEPSEPEGDIDDTE